MEYCLNVSPSNSAIFAVRQMPRNTEIKKKLYHAFVDLKKHLIKCLERVLDELCERWVWRSG